MTAKRFWKYVPDTCNPYGVIIRIVDNETGKQHGTVDDYVDLLNNLHEENQALSSQVMLYKSELDVFANQNKKLERQIKEQFDLLIKAKKQGFIDF